MVDVAGNLAAVRERIARACARAGREPGEVRLLPVSKTHGVDLVVQAYDAGVRMLAENRVQEAADKAEQLADRPDLHWAFVGHLQTNKARRVAEFAAEFHALDSVKLARPLDRRLRELDRTLDVFVEVNSSAEPQKSGLAPDDVPAFARDLREFPALRVRGLMTVAVFSEDAEAVAACFRRMQQLQERLRADEQAAGSYDELSMGMSGDLELAIAHGATTVRVGQAIFGPREVA